MRDLESIDPEYHKSLQWMLDNDITGVIDVRSNPSFMLTLRSKSLLLKTTSSARKRLWN
jgi:hypothetical protein